MKSHLPIQLVLLIHAGRGKVFLFLLQRPQLHLQTPF